MKRKIILGAVVVMAAALTLTGCTAAHVQSQNLSRQADNFQVYRDIILQDDITGQITQELKGRCSINPDGDDGKDADNETTVTCKIGEDSYVKEFFFIGDNSTLTSMQTEPISSSNPYAYKFIIKPTIIDFDLQTPEHNAGGN